MKELVKVVNENGKQLVSGRDLHEALEIGTPYHKWMPRMIDYGFCENVDFVVMDKNVPNSNGGKQTQVVHILTLDTAKHIAMVQRTEIGMQLRNYFIECEKQLKEQVPQLTSEQLSILRIVQSNSQEERMMALVEYKEVITAPLIETIEKQQPCVNYVEAVTGSDESILVRELCKKAYTEDKIQVGEKKLYNILRHWGYICKRGTEPTQRALESGYFEVDCRLVNKGGTVGEVFTTKVRPKGCVRIIDKLSKMTIEEVDSIHREAVRKNKKRNFNDTGYYSF